MQWFFKITWKSIWSFGLLVILVSIGQTSVAQAKNFSISDSLSVDMTPIVKRDGYIYVVNKESEQYTAVVCLHDTEAKDAMPAKYELLLNGHKLIPSIVTTNSNYYTFSIPSRDSVKLSLNDVPENIKLYNILRLESFELFNQLMLPAKFWHVSIIENGFIIPLFISILGFVLFFMVRDITFLHYSLYAFFLGLYFVFSMNVSPYLIFKCWCGTLYLTAIKDVLQFLFQIQYILFISSLLNTKLKFPKLHRLIKLFLWISIVCLLLYLISKVLFLLSITWGKSIAFWIFNVYRIVSIIISIYLLYRLYTKVDRIYLMTLIGTLILILAAALAFYVSYIKTLTLNTPPLHIMLIGAILELLFLFIALGIKTKNVYQERHAFDVKLKEEFLKNEEILKNQQYRLTEALKLKETQLKAEEEIKLNNLNELKEKEKLIESLQLQLNPHFLFNLMNSLKLFILKDKTEDAVNQIDRLSSYIRSTLKLNKQKEISIKEELENLQNYFHLENIRLNNTLTLHINNDLGAEALEKKIPPLLLQPIVENAIWHGLATSPNVLKEISIVIKKVAYDLIIEIIDNGIGIDFSQSTPKKKDHESMAIAITQKRIELYTMGRGTLKIENMYDLNGNSEGTKVSISLPLKQRRYRSHQIFDRSRFS